MSDQHEANVPQPPERIEEPAADPSVEGRDQAEDLAAGEKFTPEKLGDAAVKFATETVYAAAGLANVIAEKARELYETQRKQIAEHAPEGVDPNFRQFVDSMPDQFKNLLDEASRAYRDLAERGRATVADLQSQVQASVQAARTHREAADEHTEAFDLKDDAQASAEAESAVAPEGPEASGGGAAASDASRPDPSGEPKGQNQA